MGPVLGPHARANRTRDTWVAEPWLPAPENERPEEGQRLTPDAPHNGGRPPPPGTAPHHPRGRQPPQGMQAEGTLLGPHTRTLDNNAWRTPAPKEGSRGEESTWPRAPLATGSPLLRRRPGEAPNAHTNARTPAGGASVRAPPLTPHRAHSTCTSHGKSAPHHLLLGTATQQWQNPRPHAKHAPVLRRWTRHTRSSGHWDSEAAKETPHRRTRARTPTWR